MNIKMNGKKIYQVWWPDTETQQDSNIKTGRNRILELSATHHGDHDEFWIVEMNADRKELARHNSRYVETIIWDREKLRGGN